MSVKAVRDEELKLREVRLVTQVGYKPGVQDRYYR